MTKNFILTLVGFLSVSVSLSAQSNSSTQDSVRQLKEVVVSYQAEKFTPITYQNIEQRLIDAKSVSQEPSLILSEFPSVTAYTDAGHSQGYSYIRLRGVDQTRINFTLDGVPLNEPEDQGTFFSNYPDILQSIGRMQLQHGVGTSKNGVASYGGSLQLFSPNLADSSYTNLGVGYGSFRSLRAFGEYNSGLKDNKALYARFSHVRSDGYKYNSSNQGQSAFVSSGWFGNRSTLKLYVLAGQQRNELAWLGVAENLIAMDPRTNGNENEKDNFKQAVANLQHHYLLNKKMTYQSSLYYTFADGNYDFNLNNFLGLPTTEELYNYAFRSNLGGGFVNMLYKPCAQLNLTMGAHANSYQRRHIGSEATLGQLYENIGFKNEQSVFAKAEYIKGKINLFADLQYRHASFDYDGGVPLARTSWSFLNPKAGVSYAPTPAMVWYYSLGSTGREPTRNDMFGGNDDLLADSNGIALINITTPEYVTDQELGVRFQKKHWHANVNLYYMDFCNEIVLAGKFGPNGLALNNNVENSFRTGLETSITYQWTQNWRFTNHASYNISRIKEQGESFSPILTPRVIVFQEAEYRQNNFQVALNGRYQAASFIDFANTQEVGNYFLVNARAGFNVRNVQLTLFVNNLTNVQYFNNGYVDFDGSRKLFVQAPLNGYLSLGFRF